MNKKDIKDFKRIKEIEEEELLMSAIHNNAKEQHERHIMKNNLKKIKQEKRAKNRQKLLYAMLGIFAVTILILAAKYNDYAQTECISNGFSKNFCEKNLR